MNTRAVMVITVCLLITGAVFAQNDTLAATPPMGGTPAVSG